MKFRATTCRLSLAFALTIAWMTPAAAQAPPATQASPAAQAPPVAQAPPAGNVVYPVRVAEPPRIDGLLDESLWNDIEPVTDLRQLEPEVGEPVTERTEIYIAYDDEFLYFGIRAHDSEPDKIVARQFERDSNLDADDSISIGIDSLNDNRTAFAFQTNVLGTQRDLELTEAGAINFPWDTIWYSAGNIDELGYTLEMAIPFFALRFQPAESIEMGVILERIIRRKNEKANWPSLSRDYSFLSVSQYATMAGFEGIERGVALELKPYVSGGYSEIPEERVWDADIGLDTKWGITSDLTADLTVNPDFAQVESDALQINLTRFSLFFPEKRDFFLERADLFSFGLPREAEVFFSRRIGIRGRREVPIIAGARTYGLVGNTNLGVMTMQTSSVDEVPTENFTVARVKQNVLGRSYAGGIVTARNGDVSREDTTVGGDFQFLFGVNSRVQGSVAHSSRPDVGSDNWFADVSASQRYDLYDWVVQYTDIGEQFLPGIGFVQRPNLRRIRANGHFKPRPGWRGVRQLTMGLLFQRIENHDGSLETQLFRPGFLTTFQSEDVITILYFDTFEHVPVGFGLAPGVTIPAGDYKNRQLTASFSSSPSRWWGIGASHTQGSFYDGELRSSGLVVQVQPVPRIRVRSENQYDNVDVPSGAFDSLITRLFVSYYFSPELTTRVGAQYSSLFDESVFNFRVRWIYTPGSEAWVVYDEGRRFGLSGRVPSLLDRAFIVKVVHNFHF